MERERFGGGGGGMKEEGEQVIERLCIRDKRAESDR